MPLDPGTRLGPYEIVTPLGAGGMGEVYRARDTRLDRDVAVKVLPQHLSDNPEIRARFEREAKTVSSLNHPHICTLFDIGREGDTDYLVMELIEGETLAERLTKGALPVAEVLALGGQIAEALERAHRAGVVHRDLKPGNVMLTKSGAKLMDFGLARAVGLAGSGTGSDVAMPTATHSPTMAAPLTAEGTILGTFQYMAPEQLEGIEADARSDLWALGCVLYEMATGRRAFEGKSQASLITSIMSAAPAPLSQVAPMSPPGLERLVQACLTRDPADRLQSAHDIRMQLEWLAEGGSQVGVPAPVATRRRSRERLAWGIAAAAVLALLFVSFRPGGPSSDPAGAEGTSANRQLRLEVPAVAPGAARLEAVITPDGKQVISVQQEQDGTTGLYAYALETGERRRIALEEYWPSELFVSSDSAWLGYLVMEGIKRVRIDGGVPESVLEIFLPLGATWLDDETAVFSIWGEHGVRQVSTRGGDVQGLTELDPEKGESRHWVLGPGARPGEVLLGIRLSRRAEERLSLETLDVESGKRQTLREIDMTLQVTIAGGNLLWIKDEVLLQTPITPDGRADGPATTVVEGVRSFSISDDGTLLLDRQSRNDLYKMFWVDLDGQRTREASLERPILIPSFSPDGRFLAGHFHDQAKVHDVARGITMDPLPDQAREVLVRFSADGKDILLSSDRDDGEYRLYRMAADGSGQPELLLDGGGVVMGTAPDGRSIVYCRSTPERSRDIWLLPEGEEPRLLLGTAANECGTLYGDGRWLVHTSDETGQTELFARAVEGPGRWQLTTTGVRHVEYLPTRNEVYYMLPGKLMRIRLDTTGDELAPGRPEVRVEGRFPPLGTNRVYAVAPDGRVLLPELDPEAAASQARLEVWLGWGD